MDWNTDIIEELTAIFGQELSEAMAGTEGADIWEMEGEMRVALQRVGARCLGAWLEKQGQRQGPAEVPCACGGRASYVRKRRCVLLTCFGRVQFRRSYYVCPVCHEGQYPLDQALGYQPGQLTPRLASLAGLVGAALPYERGSQLLAELSGVSLARTRFVRPHSVLEKR